MTERLDYSSAGATRNRDQAKPISNARIHATDNGFQVRTYNQEGPTSEPVHFKTYRQAQEYAASL